ncbi:hypothetical protein AgCh_028871 [Apium graveolens]
MHLEFVVDYDVYRRELGLYFSAYHKEFEDRREIAVPLPGNEATIIWTALPKRPLLCPPLTVVIDIGTEVDTFVCQREIHKFPCTNFQVVRLCKVSADGLPCNL